MYTNIFTRIQHLIEDLTEIMPVFESLEQEILVPENIQFVRDIQFLTIGELYGLRFNNEKQVLFFQRDNRIYVVGDSSYWEPIKCKLVEVKEGEKHIPGDFYYLTHNKDDFTCKARYHLYTEDGFVRIIGDKYTSNRTSYKYMYHVVPIEE